MAVYPKGKVKPGTPDRRSYEISVMLHGRRVRLLTGTRHKHIALAREQEMRRAMEENPLITLDRLRALVRGEAQAAKIAARQAASGPTFGEVALKTYKERWAMLDDAKGFKSTLNTLALDIPDDTPISAIDRHFIKRVFTALQERNQAHSTINRKMSAISVIMEFAVEELEILENKPRMPKRLKARKRDSALSEAQFAALMAEVARHDTLDDLEGARNGRPRKRDAVHYLSLYEFLYETGMRPGEALQLRWQDVDFDLEGGTVYAKSNEKQGMKTKTDKTRAIPLTDLARNILLALRETTTERPFERCNANRTSKLWSEARDRLGITDKDVVCYSCRHSYATRVQEETGDIHLVKELLGHANIALTSDTYAHVSSKYLKRGSAALNKRNQNVTRTTMGVTSVTE